MKHLKILLAVLTSFTLASCEDVVQIKLDEGTPMITIDAFVNNLRTPQTIRLTYTDNYFSQKPNTTISGAAVQIKDVTSGQLFNFTDNSNGNYVFNLSSTDTIGKIGHQYELSVTHQGNNYTSTSTMYRTAKIDTIVIEYKAAGAFGTKEGYDLYFLGQDPTGDVADFYWVKSYNNGVFYNKGININTAWDAANGPGADGLFFIPPIARGILPRGDRLAKFDLFRVEIHSISRQTYDFLNQVQTQTTNSGLFATTPENVKTNITTTSATKVVGWFNMAAVDAKQIVVQ